MAKVYGFSGDNVSRIRKVVHAVEQEACVLSRGPRIGNVYVRMDRPRLLRAKIQMAANNTEYSCVYLHADGTEGDTVTCMRPTGVGVSGGDVGFLGRDNDNNRVFVPIWPNMSFVTGYNAANIQALIHTAGSWATNAPLGNFAWIDTGTCNGA